MARVYRYRGHLVEVIIGGDKQGHYRHCQLAIDHIPAMPFDVCEADFQAFNPQQRDEFLARQAIGLVEEHGDARAPRPFIPSEEERALA
jgi:hypothetical protein